MFYYAGIGSRETPEEVLNLMTELAEFLAKKGFTLRSGGAQGADKAFEKGADKVSGKKEIFIPWANFEGSKSTLIVKDNLAFELAKKYHPNYDKLSLGAKKLQARNTHQVLGPDLKTPSDFIICYTKNGTGAGGTGQAIRIAKDNGIRIFDLGGYKDLNDFKKEFNEYYLSLIKNSK